MTTRRDFLTGLAALPIAASLPALPARAMTTGEKLKAFYDDCAAEADTVKPWARYDHAAPEFEGWVSDDLLRIQASIAETVRRIENMRS